MPVMEMGTQSNRVSWFFLVHDSFFPLFPHLSGEMHGLVVWWHSCDDSSQVAHEMRS